MENQTEHDYLQRRERLARAWPWVGASLLAALLGLAVWLWWRTPLLIDPWLVMRRLAANDLGQGTLALMATMLPVLVILCLVLSLGLVLLGFQGMRNERRLLKLLKRHRDTGPP